jgi:hypothetical protein
LALLVGLPALVDSLRFDAILTREDTRTQASAWVEPHLPAGTSIAVDWFPFGPPLSPERHDLLVANGWSLFDLTVDDYRRRGIRYVVASSYTYDQWILDPARDAKRRAFYAALQDSAELVAEFRPYRESDSLPFVYDQIYGPYNELERVERPGPTVRVYRLRPETTY